MRALTAGASVLALWAGAAAAQTAEAPTGAGVDAALDEIVVTAQRREQSGQDIGIALSAIDGDALLDRGVTSVNQLEYIAPSLEVEQAFGGGQPQFRLRGVGFEDYATNNTPTVGTYIDEVAFPIPAMTQGLLLDLERVEVLRGPQGTLYGRNTTGGAINFIANKPTDELSAGLTGEYGRFDAWRAEGFVSGPIAGNLRARIAVGTEQGGGFQRNRLDDRGTGDADRIGARAQLEYGDEVGELRVTGYYQRDESDTIGLYLFEPFRGIAADRGVRRTGWGTSASFAALAGIDPDTAPFRDNEGYGVSLRGEVTIDEAITLVSLSSYNRLERREYNDWDASQFSESDVFFRSNADVYSQEIRFSNAYAGPFRWLIGGYYSSEKLDEEFRSGFTDVFGFDALTSYGQKVETISAFGQFEYRLSPRLNIVAGVRYEDERRELERFTTVTFPFVPIGIGPLDRVQKLDEVTGRAAIEYNATDDILVYASASRGVKSGGFTAINSLSAEQIAPFEAEELYAYELGFKADLFGRLRLNGAIFYYDYSNQQVQSVVIDPGFGALGRIVNAPESEIKGGEVELIWAPTTRLTFSQTLGYKEGEFKRFTDVDLVASLATGFPFRTVTVDRDGDDLGFPKLSYAGSASYRFDLGGGLELTPAVDYSFRDEQRPRLLGPDFNLDSYWLVDARLTLGPADGPWSVALWGRNILDERYDETRNFFVNARIASPGRPATYGVRAGLRF